MGDLIHAIVSNPDVGSALAGLVIAILTTIASFLGVAGKRFLDAHSGDRRLSILQQAATIAVQMVEQTMPLEASEAKKAQAIAVVQSYLDRAGVKGFSVAEIESAVEAAVYACIGQLLPAVLETTSPPAAPEPVPVG